MVARFSSKVAFNVEQKRNTSVSGESISTTSSQISIADDGSYGYFSNKSFTQRGITVSASSWECVLSAVNGSAGLLQNILPLYETT